MHSPLMFINVGPTEVMITLFIIILLFGAKKLPELARSMGKSLGEFKKGRAEGEREEIEKAKPSDADDDKEDGPKEA